MSTLIIYRYFSLSFAVCIARVRSMLYTVTLSSTTSSHCDRFSVLSFPCSFFFSLYFSTYIICVLMGGCLSLARTIMLHIICALIGEAWCTAHIVCSMPVASHLTSRLAHGNECVVSCCWWRCQCHSQNTISALHIESNQPHIACTK